MHDIFFLLGKKGKKREKKAEKLLSILRESFRV
jgi:hypothetical protein